MHDSLTRQLATRPLIMGVLNVTPDSFSDGGRFATVEMALEQAQAMQDAGANIIDVGGESTRPGAVPVTVDEELTRVLPVIAAITARFDMRVSVDTSKARVMREAVAAGASMINDVWALRQPDALETAAAAAVPVCLMHMQGSPGTMQQAPGYADVVAEVTGFLKARAAACIAAGIPATSIVLDPGFGFGKRLSDNLDLLNHLDALTALGFPVLAGLSRKSMIGQMTGAETDQRLTGSVILAALAVRNGASIVRVHDVAETRDALMIIESLRSRQIERCEEHNNES